MLIVVIISSHKQEITIHKTKHDTCWECDRHACATVRGERRVATTHPKTFAHCPRSLHTTRKCLTFSVCVVVEQALASANSNPIVPTNSKQPPVPSQTRPLSVFNVFFASGNMSWSIYRDVNGVSWFWGFHTACGWGWLTTFRNSQSVPPPQVK